MTKTNETKLHPFGRMLILLLLAACTGIAAAGGAESFTEARFKALQGEGALVLVDVHASWCPTCAKQQKILDEYQAARPDVELHRLLVDFDDQKEWVKHFRAPRQSTFALFRGDEQIWFAVAETRKDVIFAKLDEAAGVSQ